MGIDIENFIWSLLGFLIFMLLFDLFWTAATVFISE